MSPPIVEAAGVDKRFGPTVALADVGLSVHEGESHALVGRNGAGKSTLVSILTGLTKPDSGTVAFGGEPAPALADRDGWRRRVACVYQHSTVIGGLSVAENLFLNRQPTRRGFVSWRALRRQARELLDSWGVAVDPAVPAGELSVEDRQTVEIARALSYGARFIVLDEPTAQLDSHAIRRLFDRVGELQRSGVTFLFISHHLEEIYAICQTVTVLRDARHVVTAPVADLAKAELVEAMTGGEGAPAGPGATPRESARSSAPPVLSVRGLSGAAFADVSFDVRVGEVIGIAGSNASGKHQLAETLYGLRAPSAGEVTVSGSAVAPGDVVAALRRGIALVPRDRHDQGVVPGMSIADNAAMTVLDRLGPAGIVRRGKLLGMGTRAIAEYDMVAAGADVPVAELSGGNQQKVVLARALASDPGVLVLINPTAGVDVRSKEALLAVVERVRERGTAVLIVSDELDDLRSCDRVLVLRSGHLTAEHPAGWPDAELVASIEGVDLDGE